MFEREGENLMKGHAALNVFTIWIILVASGLHAPDKVVAHCDGLDGPVVTAARKALTTGDVNRVLIWVKKQDEAVITEAFQQTLAVRTLSSAAKKLADRYFFETLVRVHRTGEGAPYTGLKPAGRDLGPAIPAADKALEDGTAESLLELLTVAMHDGVRERFEHVMAKKPSDPDDVAAGQAYVQAYVAFIHYVERLYEAATYPAHGHFPEVAADGAHK
jgi:hypothetical protein